MRYLLLTFYRKPAGQIDEERRVAPVLKSRDLQQCSVIMDYRDEKVIKCVIEGKMVPTSFEQLNEYYKKIYPEAIEQLELINHKRFEKKE
jgi:hypothetical protein